MTIRPGSATRIGARGVTRAFGPVVANDRVELSVAPGTVHAVVGENGAGKTTLMRILYGLDKPDGGSVVVDGEAVSLSCPRDGLARGIGMVHQELSLIPDLTLLENLVLGREPSRGPFVDWDAARRQAGELAERTGVDLDWDTTAARAPVSVRQRLEILRLLYQGADVLILDEPTAVLAPAQAEELFALLRDLAAAGHTVVFISHKLDEVLAVADEVTVLRRGRAVASMPASETSAPELARLMVGAEVPGTVRPEPREAGRAILEVSGLRARDDRGVERLRGAGLTVRAGEVVGIAAVTGNGQEELVECVVGLRRADAGVVRIGGEDLTAAGVGRRRRAGLAYISPDRHGEGLAIEASLTANALAGRHRRAQLAAAGWLRPRAVGGFVRAALARFGVRHDLLAAPAAALSGGNQQRLVLARELDDPPPLLVAAQPTRGVDVAGIAFVHEQLLELRAAGGAVLLVSEEIDELLALSDRIVVLYRGEVAGEVGPQERDRALLGRLMTGEAAA